MKRQFRIAVQIDVELFDIRVDRIDLRCADAIARTGRLRRCAVDEQQCRDQKAEIDAVHDFPSKQCRLQPAASDRSSRSESQQLPKPHSCGPIVIRRHPRNRGYVQDMNENEQVISLLTRIEENQRKALEAQEKHLAVAQAQLDRSNQDHSGQKPCGITRQAARTHVRPLSGRLRRTSASGRGFVQTRYMHFAYVNLVKFTTEEYSLGIEPTVFYSAASDLGAHGSFRSSARPIADFRFDPQRTVAGSNPGVSLNVATRPHRGTSENIRPSSHVFPPLGPVASSSRIAVRQS